MSKMLASRRLARVRLHSGPRAGRSPRVRRSIGAPFALILVLAISPAARAQIVTCPGSDTVILDCDGNNTDDYCDIAQFGTSEDADADGIPNECDFVTYRRLLCDGFETPTGAPIHDADCDGDGFGWTNPSLSWTINNQGCPSSSGKALKGVAQTPPGSDFMESEFFRPFENGRMDCGAHQYKFTADLRSEAQLNPRIDWQIMLRDATNDANVILIHVASTQSSTTALVPLKKND